MTITILRETHDDVGSEIEIAVELHCWAGEKATRFSDGHSDEWEVCSAEIRETGVEVELTDDEHDKAIEEAERP